MQLLNSQDFETTHMPISGSMDEKDVVYTYNGILFSHKKGQYPAIFLHGPWADYARRDKSDLHVCMLSRAMDHSPPDSSVHGILQARILDWVGMRSSGGASRFRN